ncbi:Uma2 family endonuclease [Streptomyces sp. PA5.6]|uniref:Uma2 family endonuclease n=1 Tax=Streptomyces sp. PA5.6 TaxID=3035651 RepID=UPI003904B486
MTRTDDGRRHIAPDDFEELARGAPETVTLEFVDGKLEVRPVRDGNHGEIVMWLTRQCMQQRPELGLYSGQGMAIEGRPAGRARPDGVLAPIGTFGGQGEWADPGGVLMTIEVTSCDGGQGHRHAYARAGIPVHLLIDRGSDTLAAYSDPLDGDYRQAPAYAYGAEVALPAPVAVTLNTEQLKNYTA